MPLKMEQRFDKAPSLDGVGPTWTFTRANDYTPAFRAPMEGNNSIMRPNEPRYYGWTSRSNWLLDPDDMTAVSWTKTNVSVAKDAVGYDGVANSAFTITDDATNGMHFVHQDPVVDNSWGSAENIGLEFGIMVWVNATQSTAEYVTFSSAIDVDDTNRSITVRMSDGVIVDGGEYYRWNADLDAEFVMTETSDATGDKWYCLFVMQNDSSVGNERFFSLGFNNTGVTASGAAYVGTGDTLVVSHPGWVPLGFGTSDYTPFDYWPPIDGGTYLRKYYATRWRTQLIGMSSLGGYDGKGTTPEPMWYQYSPSYLYGWVEGVTTAEADAVTLTKEWQLVTGEGVRRSRDDLPAKGVRCYGTGQYTLMFQGSWQGNWDYGAWFTISCYIEDITTAPTGPIISLRNIVDDGGHYEGDTEAYITDMDEEGWVSLTARFRASWATQGIIFGLGADGNDDTGDFTWSCPMWNKGRYRDPYIVNTSESWTMNMSTISPGHPKNFKDVMDTVSNKGLFIEPAATNMITGYKAMIADPNWTPTGGTYSPDASGWHDGFGRSRQHNWLAGANPETVGEFSTAHAIQGLQADTLYTARYAIHNTAGFFSAEARTDKVWRFAIDDQNGQDISIEMTSRLYESADDKDYLGWPKIDGVSFVVGADVVDWELNGTGNSWTHIMITFRTDPVVTTGTWKLSRQDAVGNTDMTINNFTRIYSKEMQVTPGRGTNWVGDGTRDAEVLSTTDMSWFNNGGPGGVDMAFWTRGKEDICMWSASDGTANNRIELITTSAGVLNLVGYASGVEQFTVVGPVISMKERVGIQCSWDTGHARILVNGTEYVDAVDSIPTGLTQFNIGSNWNDVNQINGLVHKIRYFDEVLAPAEDGTQDAMTMNEWHAMRRRIRRR